MMTFYVAGSTDEQKAQFVQTMRHGTMKGKHPHERQIDEV
jgi:hypothetical protein